MKSSKLASYTWVVIVFSVLLILWGAYMGATGSAAGCGGQWPLCNGALLPSLSSSETLIAYIHWLGSGLVLFLALILLLWTWRAFPAGHPARLGAMSAMLLIVLEALLGALLALSGEAVQEASLGRGIVQVLHLILSFLLLAGLALTARWAAGGDPLHLKGHGVGAWLFGFALLGLILVGVGGVLNAMGDALASPDLGAWHPLAAILVSVFVLFTITLVSLFRSNPLIHRLSKILAGLILAEMVAGLVNSILQAPVWMQLMHLLLAVLVWIVLVVLAAVNFAESEVCHSIHAPETDEHSAA
ncbi:MAG: COX15/CtaA family protein [Anaerolineales bacterium]|nr:COX15/CtaA family protein [Anaerolineales bacterium]